MGPNMDFGFAAMGLSCAAIIVHEMFPKLNSLHFTVYGVEPHLSRQPSPSPTGEPRPTNGVIKRKVSSVSTVCSLAHATESKGAIQ